MKSILLLVQVIILSCITLESPALEVGSSCNVETTGETGTCRLFSDCPGAEEQAKKNINVPLCGFHQLTVPIVCCANTHKKNSPSQNDLGLGTGDFTFPTDQRLHQVSSSSNELISKRSTISEQKCAEYTKGTMDVVHALPLVIGVKPLSINLTKCDFSNRGVALVVGGTLANPGEFPFMTAIGFPNSENQPEWRCGGTLISDRWVLTAAHCTYSVENPKWIRLGALDMSKDYETERTDYLIKQIVVHPDYKYPEKYNDIALLESEEQIQFSEVVRPACLYTKSSVNQIKTVSATGWGQTDFAGPNSDKLLTVNLNIYDNSICTKAYEKDIKTNNQLSKGIMDTMLCAGELRGGRDTCLGDSGGPLFVRDEENQCKFYVLGITSFGKLCGQENVPAIYTRVPKYIQWIENIVWK